MADFRLDRLSPADEPNQRRRLLHQRMCEKIEEAFNGLSDTLDAVIAAQAAADAANAAAETANAAAESITTTAELANSYVSGATITAQDAGSDVTITISAHTRHYPQADGTTTTVAVSGGSLTGRAYETSYYIYYDQPSRAGGAVTYQSTTSEATAAQLGDRHVVGGVLTPAAAAADTTGGYTRPPGSGSIKTFDVA